MTAIGFLMLLASWLILNAARAIDDDAFFLGGALMAIVGAVLVASGISVKLWEVMP